HQAVADPAPQTSVQRRSTMKKLTATLSLLAGALLIPATTLAQPAAAGASVSQSATGSGGFVAAQPTGCAAQISAADRYLCGALHHGGPYTLEVPPGRGWPPFPVRHR